MKNFKKYYLFFFLLTSFSAYSSMMSDCEFLVRKFFTNQTTATFDEIEWKGVPIPEKEWEYYRVLRNKTNAVSNPKAGEVLNVFNYEERLKLNITAYARSKKYILDQKIRPLNDFDKKLLKMNFSKSPGESGVVRVYLKDKSVIEGDIFYGGYDQIGLFQVKRMIRSVLNEMKNKGVEISDIVEVEASHVHPFPEFFNESQQNFVISPLSFNDLSGSFRNYFKEEFPDALFTINAVLRNGYAYEESYLWKEQRRIDRELYWTELITKEKK